MSFTVLKFGGSSLSTATNISRVLDIVEGEAAQSRVILVCSAIGGCTDALENGSLDALEELYSRHADIVTRLFTGEERKSVLQKIDSLFADIQKSDNKVVFGEMLSTLIVSQKLKADGISALLLDSTRLVVKDNEEKTFENILEAVEASTERVLVAAGFICGGANGAVTTLGRGGSDYSAALYAAAIKAHALKIFTDVPGIMTANPRQVPQARTIPRMTYTQAFTMAQKGAKVLYAPTVAPAMNAGIDIQIRNTFAPDGPFTVVGGESAGPLVGLASRKEGPNVILSVIGNDVPSCGNILSEAGIDALDERRLDSCVEIILRPAVEDAALRALHHVLFQLRDKTVIPVYIAGEGAVGTALRNLIEKTGDTITERSGKKLFVAGHANSRFYTLEGKPSRNGSFADAVCLEAAPGAIFVDATDSDTIHGDYIRLLEAGVSVVSSNRRALAVPYREFAAMRSAARERGLVFRYSTTVGAALPILESISRGADSSDRLVSLEAVMSCTLNQILGSYTPGKDTLAACLRKAQEEGLTEQDPRMDIGGEDALRKLLILSREAGIPIDREDVQIVPVVPETYRTLEEFEPVFSQAVKEAEAAGLHLRFMASLEAAAGRVSAKISMVPVGPSHPAYYLKGTENAFIVKTALKPYPLVLQGPGEGAGEAASSLLSDILR